MIHQMMRIGKFMELVPFDFQQPTQMATKKTFRFFNIDFE